LGRDEDVTPFLLMGLQAEVKFLRSPSENNGAGRDLAHPSPDQEHDPTTVSGAEQKSTVLESSWILPGNWSDAASFTAIGLAALEGSLSVARHFHLLRRWPCFYQR
jgi:hypothetical protein